MIQDEFSDKPMSRQRRYQLRRARDGRCIICGKTAESGSYCSAHKRARRVDATIELVEPPPTASASTTITIEVGQEPPLGSTGIEVTC